MSAKNLPVCGYTVPQLYPVLCIRVRVARPRRARFTCAEIVR